MSAQATISPLHVPPQCRRMTRRTYWIDPQTVEQLNRDGGSKVTGSVLEGLLGGAAVLQLIKRDEHCTVERVAFGGRQWILKRYHHSKWSLRWSHFRRRTPAWRYWEGARRLRSLGIRVASPVMLIHDKRRRSRSQVLVLPYVEGVSLHDYLRRASKRGRHTSTDHTERRHIAAAIGRQVRALSTSDVVNAAHTAQRLLIDEKCRTGMDEPLITHARSLTSGRGDRAAHRMLADLWRSTKDAGDVAPREALRCVRAALGRDAKRVRRHKRLRDALRRIDADVKSR